MWSTLQKKDCIVFTRDRKDMIPSTGGVVLFTTYSMIGYGGNRSDEGKKVFEQIQNREWGLLLLDEVHVAPAESFKKVMNLTKTHCKIGLTATLVREDGKIRDLNHLIGPKLYEANWMDLTRQGFLANVKCVEVWCEMTAEYHKVSDDSWLLISCTFIYLLNYY
jgi:DNA excision repair protein ERCC-3